MTMIEERKHDSSDEILVEQVGSEKQGIAKDLAIKLLEALKNGLHETGKDFPYRDEIIPPSKEALSMAIKSLKQQPCEDAISRQAVLEIFGLVMNYWKEHAIDVEPHEIEDALIKQYEFTAKQLSELPPVTPVQEWIPASERLPKAGEFVGKVAKYYLVQNEYGDMMVAHYNGKYWEQIFQLGPITDEIIAWCELPVSYKKKGK